MKYKKHKYNKRKIFKEKNIKICRELNDNGVLIGISLEGTYGLDPFFDLDDKLVDKM